MVLDKETLKEVGYIMGNFISLSGVIGKTKTEVFDSLKKYSASVYGNIEQLDKSILSGNYSIILEENLNTTVFYQQDFLEWTEASRFISNDLGAAVFSLHIHDSDLWMYLLFDHGNEVDRFNPVPDYWDLELNRSEIRRWKGNASTVAKYVSHLKPEMIKNYLVRWEFGEEEIKAYPEDRYSQEEWQMVDFMDKLRLPYPIDGEGTIHGETFRLLPKKMRTGRK
jgi:hypothetical protein